MKNGISDCMGSKYRRSESTSFFQNVLYTMNFTNGNLSELIDMRSLIFCFLIRNVLALFWKRNTTDASFIFSRDLNRLIMDYLVIEGYKSAAEEFSQEANLPPTVDFESIESRMVIREALQRGDVEDAITRVNDLNPEVNMIYHFCSPVWRQDSNFSCTILKPSGLTMRLNTKIKPL